ncbi:MULTISPECIES: TetR/AcrR family transcriptional regulator [unclassified Streptomyces]|uniref:TetR/AcrR family transcriptional regulator n=1 Tax=unclassified Streptomyces TaxID=2593676 RepID=UPI00168BBC20|nr:MULTISPECIES: TetR family transcriptional regulator [unclassified Streptomyces]MBD3003815.1 TetR/AcrR family transcriptional regulator [Streptomyces sp. 5-10]
MNARAPGRPRILSRARIVASARHIADNEGLEALTVRRVAQELGTGQASLYRHIADRNELLTLLADDVAVHLPPPKDGPDPRERVIGQWLNAYDYLSQHLWAARIIAEGEHAADSAAAFTRSAVDALAALARVGSGEGGPDQAGITRTYRVLWHLLLGHLLNAHPVGHAHPVHDIAAENGGEGPAKAAETFRDDFAWALPRVLEGLLGTHAS